MNKKTILYIVVVLVVAAIVGLVIWDRQKAEQPILIQGHEQPIPQGDEQALDNIQFDGLNVDFKR